MFQDKSFNDIIFALLGYPKGRREGREGACSYYIMEEGRIRKIFSNKEEKNKGT